MRLKRLSVIIPVIAVILIITVLLALRFLPETEFIRSNVQDRLQKLTGQQVSVGSITISPSCSGALCLYIKGIAVVSPQGKLLLSADELTLKPDILPLFNKEIAIESVSVHGLRATVKRNADGTMAAVFIPVPGASEPERAKDLSAQDRPGGQEEQQPESDKRIKWSVDTVTLTNARIDWIDQHVLPGQEMQASLRNVNANLTRNKSDQKVDVRIEADLSFDGEKRSSVKCNGFIQPAPSMESIEAASLNIATGSLNLRHFDLYLPAWLDRRLAVEHCAATLNWAKNGKADVKFKSALKSETKLPAQLKVHGDVVASSDFSSLESAAVTTETDNFPMSFLAASLPKDLPLDTDTGVIKALVKSEWKNSRNWSVRGTITLEDVVPSGALKGLAEKSRIHTQARLGPDTLELESLEIFESARVASLKGTITKPFVQDRNLELQAQVLLRPEWSKKLGINLPPGVAVKGAIPVSATLRGRLERLWVDMKADLSGPEIEWLPYFEKPVGHRASISVKGNFLPLKQQISVEPAVVNIGLTGVNLRIDPKGKWIPGKFVAFESKCMLRPKRVDLKEATLSVRDGHETGDILTFKGDLNELGSPAPNVDGTVALRLDTDVMTVLMAQNQDFTIKGSAPLKARISGSPSELNWSVAMPLTNLDVTAGQWFRKPGGFAGNIKGSGKFSAGQLDITSGQVTFPGVVLNAKGKALDRKGDLGDITLDLSKTDLKQLTKLIPAATQLKIAGPVDASITISKRADKIVPHGKVRLNGVDYHPGSGLELDRIKGDVDLHGTALETSELTCNVRGTLEGPLKVKGSVKHIDSVPELNGNFSIAMDSGKIRADRLKAILDKANLALNVLFNVQEVQQTKLLSFKSLSGDFRIRQGDMVTNNLTVKGSDIRAGALGTLRLSSMSLDAFAGIQTYTAVVGALGKIPAVNEAIKKHGDLLKITGLDKELKRFGIGEDSGEAKTQGDATVKKTPVTLLLKIHGKAEQPDIMPVLENALSKETVTSLKSLIN
jgi:uncharacterized protein involved in outer membrane biogenesis